MTSVNSFSIFHIFFVPAKMAAFAPKTIVFCTFFLLLTTLPQSRAALDVHYYDKTCPQVEKIIFQTVYNASMHDPKVPARILRMFFHDCFIRVYYLCSTHLSLICILNLCRIWCIYALMLFFDRTLSYYLVN